MSRRPTAMFAMDAPILPQLFPPDLLARLRELLDIDPACVVTDFGDPGLRSRLAEVEVLVTGWGCPHRVRSDGAGDPMRLILCSGHPDNGS